MIRGGTVKKVVIFDMDGLMFDTEKLAFQANKETFENYNITFDEKQNRKLIGRSDADILDDFKSLANDDQLGQKIWHEANIRYKALLSTNALQKKKGLNEILDTLEGHGIDCYVASSSLREDVKMLLVDQKVDYFFKGIVGGDEVIKSKPNPEIFENVLALSGYEKHEAIILEDSLNGVEAAFAADIDVIMVPDLVAPDDNAFRQVVAVVPDLTSTLPFII